MKKTKTTPRSSDFDISQNYKERMRAECHQLMIRIKNLENLLKRMEDGTIDFNVKSSKKILEEQLTHMQLYMSCLLTRAELEEIELEFYE